MLAANVLSILKFGSAKKSNICVIFAEKKSWVAMKRGGAGAKLGRPVPPRPGLKPPLNV